MTNINRTGRSSWSNVPTSPNDAPADNSNNTPAPDSSFSSNNAGWSRMSRSSTNVAPRLRSDVANGKFIRRGEKGECARELQQLLVRNGINVTVDGDFGPGTERALKQFQASKGMQADGIVGPKTLEALLGNNTTTPVDNGNNGTTTPVDNGNNGTNAANYPALASALDNGKTLRRGQKSEAIREMQTLLGITADGDFGPGTMRAVRAFQAANGLTADGIAGRNTLRALLGGGGSVNNSDPVDVGDFAPSKGRAAGRFSTSRSAREEQAMALLKANNYTPREGEVIAIQIDQDPPPGSASGSAKYSYLRKYTGQTAVFKYQNGRLVEQLEPQRSASHPGQKSSGLSPDVTGDGRGDVAHLPAGIYNYYTRPNYRGRFNPTNDFQGYRDKNQDGTISGSEKDRKHTITAIQIHKGNSSSPSSIGCQTMPPTDYNKFSSAVRRAASGQSKFTYLLVRRPNDTYGENAI
ncbi:MAG TPA: hypothetical protein DCE42_20795 [Myxococcales bacterium]|nr:hypothetical protein [Deltaproteobacteria bacterium]MBU53831.1 hypothetical protein [Deltaproteobacteria bacterium]HAA57217.1 hypothetical protein [Myxococcales bacterium]|tara:strand:+ start:14942 stop:16339 length:1398 start_codon:yes stop_codon:yes gene_type:complete